MRFLKILTFLIFSFSVSNYSHSSEIYFINMKQILNKSVAGKSAQDFLKKKLKEENKKFDKEQSSIKKQETELIAQKKVISPEEYKKKLNVLRKKNIDHQKSRQRVANEIFQKKEKARSELYKALNPILQKYMSENNIDIIIDKKNVVVAKTEIDLTDKILKLLDKDLKSINLN